MTSVSSAHHTSLCPGFVSSLTTPHFLHAEARQVLPRDTKSLATSYASVAVVQTSNSVRRTMECCLLIPNSTCLSTLPQKPFEVSSRLAAALVES